MKREEINQVIDNVVLDVVKTINDTLTDNLQALIDDFEKKDMKQYIPYSLYFATLITASSISVDIMRKSLYELLSNDKE